jgi:hypothetical protein
VRVVQLSLLLVVVVWLLCQILVKLFVFFLNRQDWLKIRHSVLVDKNDMAALTFQRGEEVFGAGFGVRHWLSHFEERERQRLSVLAQVCE